MHFIQSHQHHIVIIKIGQHIIAFEIIIGLYTFSAFAIVDIISNARSLTDIKLDFLREVFGKRVFNFIWWYRYPPPQGDIHRDLLWVKVPGHFDSFPFLFQIDCCPPAREGSREVANLTERKNPHIPVYGVKDKL